MNFIELDGLKVAYKINYKEIKHLYLRVKGNFLEINANRAFSKQFIESFIIKHKEKILNTLLQDKKSFLFGKEIEWADDELYKKEIVPLILNLVKKYEEIMGVRACKVSFRFNKSRWGSCSYKNSLIFNYYLAKLPIDIIEYVVVHELAHIRHKNHSKAFWDEVGRFLPEYRELRKKLREFEKRLL